jgi:NTE family protein
VGGVPGRLDECPLAALGKDARVSKVGLVLGAGGLTGDAFHRGVLRALHERGYDARSADVIVGTSAGSMVGAFLRKPDAVTPRRVRGNAGTVHGDRLGRAPELSPFLAALRRPWKARMSILATSLLPTGRHSTEFIAAGARLHHGKEWPQNPLWIVAVRRRDGRRVVFGRDGSPQTDVAHAVAASCAIPGFFHPVEIDGESYVDGGAHSPTNADLLRGHDFDVVLVSSPMSVDQRRIRPALDLPLRLFWHRALRREVRALRRRSTHVLTFEPGGQLLQVMGINPLHGGRVDEVERASYEHALAVLDSRPDVLEILRGRRAQRSA